MRFPAAPPSPKFASTGCSHVATALYTPMPMKMSPASSHMNRSRMSQRRLTAVDASSG